MKKIVLGMALIIASTSQAAAISRYNSLAMSCQQAQTAIRREGAVILRYPSRNVKNLTRYDRYVRDSRYCDLTDYAEWTRIPTKDNRNCPVLNCQNRSKLDDMLFVPQNRL